MLITNVTGNYFLKQNDTATEMHLAVIEVDGTPVDLTAASSVEVVIGTIEGRILTKTPTLLSAPGELTFGLDEGDLLPPGDSLLEIHIITEQNERRVAPSKGHYKLRVQAPIGALGLTVTTYTLEYFLGEVNRILFGLPQLMERGNALADRMDELIDESEQTLDVMNTTIEESRTATTESIGATIASELATQAAQQATTEAEQATVNAIQATVDAENATTDSLAQTQLSITATQAANDATLRATTQANRAEDAADGTISATADAIQATQNANDATGRANTAASRAETATSNANTATDAANTATTEANEARDNANIAASLADGIATDLLGYNSPISNFSLATRYIKHQHVRSNGSTYRAKVETQGNPLPVEPATSNAWFDLVSKKGDKGDAGTSLKPLGVKNDVSELPLTDNEPGDAYLVGQNMYMWDDEQWNDVGPIVGPQGEQGIQGDIGTGIEYVWDGTRLGVKREDESSFTYRELKGAKGDKGDKGDNAKIISLDFVIPATDALQFNGNLITIRDYTYDPAADSLQVYQNSRILYPGEDFELENGNIRLASTIADPASTTFYVQVTRSVFDIDPVQSHATVVGALGYTPADNSNLTSLQHQVTTHLDESKNKLMSKRMELSNLNTSTTESTMTIVRDANYTGGNAGHVNSGLSVYDVVRSGVNAFEWGILSTLRNESTLGENVAIYGQGNSDVDGSKTWAGVFEVRETAGGIASSSVGIEVDVMANGLNSNGRVGIDIITGKHDINGEKNGVYAGIRLAPFGNDINASTLKNGLLMTGSVDTGINIGSIGINGILITGEQTVGINLSQGTFTSSAIRLKSGTAIDLEESGAVKLKYDHLNMRVDLSHNLNLSSGGTLRIGGNQVVGNRGAAVANATNNTDVITQFNLLLSRLREHGLISS